MVTDMSASEDNLSLKAIYLGDSGDGVKVHSRFLSNCDVQATLALFKANAVSTDTAAFFIDLWDDAKCQIIETIGASEETYSKVTGEPVLTHSEYETKSVEIETSVFRALYTQL